MKHKILPLLLLSFTLAGCSTTPAFTSGPGSESQTQSLAQIENLNSKNVASQNSKTDYIRQQGIKNTALSLGAQSGLAWRSKQIDAQLSQNSQKLDQIFDFNAMLLDHNVLPPVLLEAKNVINQDGPDTIRISDQTYKIKQQAKFVTAAPTWRQYLWMNYPSPQIPNSNLLPKNSKEQKIWVRYVNEGWQNGISQANSIYDVNLGRLKEDFGGMIIYRKLLAQHMVSPPYVAKTNLGVTGNSSHLNINDQVLRITALPTLQDNSRKWKPVVAE